jgi:hypothetical protein
MSSNIKSAGEHRSSRTAKDLSDDLTASGRQLNAANADFLRIDVETALTFTGLALNTDDREKKKRNRKNARKAYDTVLHFLPRVTFAPGEEALIQEMLGRLKNDLVQLGETL